uniref:ShKT domain-containing protein n=1 Tax=Strongyloides venezuelensis TaxID=75913 RepID=A0A0K0F3T6_STRVS
MIYHANTICPVGDTVFCNFPLYNVNSWRHGITLNNNGKENSKDEQESHFRAYKNALKFLMEVPQSDNRYNDENDNANREFLNSIYKKDFDVKFNSFIAMKILKRKLTKNSCQDKHSVCKLWKNNDFCHNTFYSKAKKVLDESGIRTHASEDTSALNWRLRPLGHLAMGGEYTLTSQIKTRQNMSKLLTEI